MMKKMDFFDDEIGFKPENVIKESRMGQMGQTNENKEEAKKGIENCNKETENKEDKCLWAHNALLCTEKLEILKHH